MLALRASEQVVSPLDDRQPAELATHSARVSARHARSMRAVSKEDDLSAEVVPRDRVDSHAMHGSAIMIMVWCSAAPRSCWKSKLGDQLDVERSTFSKIRDGSDMRNRRPRVTSVADLRCHRRCGVQLVLQGSRSTPTDPVLLAPLALLLLYDQDRRA